ncbi:elongation factor P [Candidatus Falkowbacteria bacterium CG10_big_fil_rev_8_21_14_0_10_37_14]|uniref:Elongation factor P n=1 Tax=Candidatus Falkowbacteria bacterium CG10_big_fil_rev_8_21_14_0_10_37_14 TaxID=1974561 RepID=A0A2M6WUK7_9BACT|nr:elongation factor P [Candidatus Falkowbacteria bacterium]PIT96483.1 MAG: elongation factor P [Candidatus Falkowbacteria bacterium CG10_big_fil_rev_8_21_14_0_10_37_14]
MLSLSEIKIGKVLKMNNEPYVIIKADHHKMGRGGAVLKTKLKNLINGAVMEQTFQGNEKAEEAEVETKKADYLYKDADNAYFMDNESFEQFELPLDVVGEQMQFLKENTEVSTMHYEGRPVTLKLPIKVELKVTMAPPGVKGNSVGNVMKQAELETGAVINVPMFVETGDVIRINTDTGEYVERV